MGQQEAVPEHSTTRHPQPCLATGAHPLLLAQHPMAAPMVPHPRRRCDRNSPQVPQSAGSACAKPGPGSALALWPCLAVTLNPGQQIDFLA